MNNIYIELTNRFNKGRLRAIISSGQAVVLHRLAIMSKDGDWIIKEDSDTTDNILSVLEEYKAKYRFGAPLDIKWLSGGWSSHFEFSATADLPQARQYKGLRIRTDFITRPPRISNQELEILWKDQEGRDLPFVDAKNLAELKKTNREKDYAVIGELARLMPDPESQLLYSRSAMDLIIAGKKYTELISKLIKTRPVLKNISAGRIKLEKALDAERRILMHKNEKRLQFYMKASKKWLDIWPDVQKEIEGCTLKEAHKIITVRAGKVLPAGIKK